MNLKFFLPMGEKPPDKFGRGSVDTMLPIYTSISLHPSQQFPEDFFALDLLTLRFATCSFIVVNFSTANPHTTTPSTIITDSQPTALPTASKKPSTRQTIKRRALKLLAKPPTIHPYMSFDTNVTITTNNTATIKYTTIPRPSIILRFTAANIIAPTTTAATANTTTNINTFDHIMLRSTACLFIVVLVHVTDPPPTGASKSTPLAGFGPRAALATIPFCASPSCTYD
jgi:hypothetical protein